MSTHTETLSAAAQITGTWKLTRRCGVLVAAAGAQLAAGFLLFALLAELPTARAGFGTVWFWATVQLLAFSAAAGAALAAATLHATGEPVGAERARHVSARIEQFGSLAVAVAIAALGAFGGWL
ncbi:hypothetical protein [Nocardia camponoti]|uniref:Uncharacterized protein n=1 Tax=Nocardia camponoti TaxID=1616106 RepID=A0A917QUH8_9NOCA|nr:hypothetical protein [Nocardia camponoti]GGK68726.1 hypothetical protein GCM10011591_46050 [Nocardia camponoti]